MNTFTLVVTLVVLVVCLSLHLFNGIVEPIAYKSLFLSTMTFILKSKVNIKFAPAVSPQKGFPSVSSVP